MANHVVVNTDKIMSAKYGNSVSVVHSSDLDNGTVVALGALSATDREVFTAAVSATPTTDLLVFIHTPEFQGDLYLPGKTLKDFYNVANKPMRGYFLHEGDIITITDNGITGATTVGQYVIPTAGATKLSAAADLSGNTRLAFKVIEKLDATTAFSYTGSGYEKETASVLMVVKR